MKTTVNVMDQSTNAFKNARKAVNLLSSSTAQYEFTRQLSSCEATEHFKSVQHAVEMKCDR
jgi:hypothetical protein